MLLKYFVSLTIFKKCFKVQLSVTLLVYILSSKGANQLQVLYIKTLETSKETFLLKLQSSNVFPPSFLEICRSFRTASEKPVVENFVLAYYTTDRIMPMFCKLSSLVFLCVFCVLYKSKS